MLNPAAGEPLADGGAMRFIGAVANELFFKMIDAQRHDREPVGRAAGCFSVQPCAGAGQDAFGRQSLNKSLVDLLDPIVALLIVAIDRPLYGGDADIGDIGAACDVLFVPKEEVELVLLTDRSQEAIVDIVRIAGMPPHYGVVLQLGDLSNKLVRIGQHGGPSMRKRAGARSAGAE